MDADGKPHQRVHSEEVIFRDGSFFFSGVIGSKLELIGVNGLMLFLSGVNEDVKENNLPMCTGDALVGSVSRLCVAQDYSEESF